MATKDRPRAAAEKKNTASKNKVTEREVKNAIGSVNKENPGKSAGTQKK